MKFNRTRDYKSVGLRWDPIVKLTQR